MPSLGLERGGRERSLPGVGVRAPVAARARGGAAGAGGGRCPGRGGFGGAAGAELERLGADAHPGRLRAGTQRAERGRRLSPECGRLGLTPRAALPSRAGIGGDGWV